MGPLPPVTGNGDHATVALIDYLEAIRDGDIALSEERDRRYAEVAAEKEKALKIKETADLAALELAREIQTYKDEKANELRSQIERERGDYATKTDLSALSDRFAAEIKALSEKFDAAHKPVVEFMAAYGGKIAQSGEQRLSVNTVVSVMSVLIAAVFLYLALKPH